MGDKLIPPHVWAWVREVAQRDHGGDTKAAMAAILAGACEREQRPDDPWAELDARARFGR